MNHEEALNEASAYVDLYDKRTHQMARLGVLLIIFGLIGFGQLIWGFYQVDELNTRIKDVEKNYASTGLRNTNSMMELKISALRYELTLKQEFMLRTIISGGLIGVGIGWYLNRTRRQKYSAMLRGLINIIETGAPPPTTDSQDTGPLEESADVAQQTS